MAKPSEADNQAYWEYLDSLAKNKKGEITESIHFSAANAARQELALGKKGGYPVYGEEPNKHTQVQTYPEGELYKTELSETELERAVSELTEARQVLAGFLMQTRLPEFKNSKTATLLNLEDNWEVLPESVNEARDTIVKYLDPDANTLLFDVPELIQEAIKKNQVILEHLRKQQSDISKR